mgnify:CR=1 FL=1
MALATIGIYRAQLGACKAERAEIKRAYEILTRSVQVQNEAIQTLEKKSAETARRAASLRAQAQGATQVARDKADALERLVDLIREAAAPPPPPRIAALPPCGIRPTARSSSSASWR